MIEEDDLLAYDDDYGSKEDRMKAGLSSRAMWEVRKYTKDELERDWKDYMFLKEKVKMKYFRSNVEKMIVGEDDLDYLVSGST